MPKHQEKRCENWRCYITDKGLLDFTGREKNCDHVTCIGLNCGKERKEFRWPTMSINIEGEPLGESIVEFIHESMAEAAVEKLREMDHYTVGNCTTLHDTKEELKVCEHRMLERFKNENSHVAEDQDNEEDAAPESSCKAEGGKEETSGFCFNPLCECYGSFCGLFSSMKHRPLPKPKLLEAHDPQDQMIVIEDPLIDPGLWRIIDNGKGKRYLLINFGRRVG